MVLGQRIKKKLVRKRYSNHLSKAWSNKESKFLNIRVVGSLISNARKNNRTQGKQIRQELVIMKAGRKVI